MELLLNFPLAREASRAAGFRLCLIARRKVADVASGPGESGQCLQELSALRPTFS